MACSFKNRYFCGMRLFFLTLFLIIGCSLSLSHAQNTQVVVDSIEFDGNKKTKDRIMLRELTFAKGDSIPLSMLNTVLEQNCQRLMNTNLFFNAKSNVKQWESNRLIIQFKVTENWFLYPVPIFELADRNFNVWWKEQNRDLRRTNYGLRLTYNNATGRRDPLSALAQHGYTPKYSFNYSLPYLNKKQTIGFSIGYFNAVNREVGFKTDSNKVIFYKDSSKFLLHRRVVNAGLSYTPGLFASHNFSIGYSNNNVDTVVAERLNQDFYLNNNSRQQYIWLTYSFTYDKRDIRPYPINGYYAQFYMQKNGILKNDDANTFDVSMRFAKYTPLTKKWSLENNIKGKTSLIRKQQPYTLTRGMGYGGDFLKGYEYYVMDGLDFAYAKNALRYEWLNKVFDWRDKSNLKKFKDFMQFPVKSYITFNFDMGYANNPYDSPTNFLTNRFLYGGGIGIDFVTYYNMLWRFEYSINRLGEKGLYFNYSIGF